MRVIFRKDRSYADNEQSARDKAPDKELRANAALRFGGTPKDYTVVETAEPAPWFCKLQNGEVISDSEKIAAHATRLLSEDAKASRRAILRAKISDHTAGTQEICEYLIPE